MNTKKTIILAGIIMGLLFGCVGFKRIKIPLSTQEELFYENFKKNSSYPVDSITREIIKEIIHERDMHMFIDIYTSVDSLQQDIVDNQADEIAAFVFSDLKIDRLKFQQCHIGFAPRRNISAFYDYKFDNGKYTLIKKW